MGKIISLRGCTPQIGKNVFLAEGACIVGDVILGDHCSVWFNAVIRGDVNGIRIGNGVNIQDGAVLHTLYKASTVCIDDYASIGHGAILHGAQVGKYALIGMGAVIMDYAEVGEGAIVAAGAVVTKGTKIEPYTLWAGVPAKKIRDLSQEEVQRSSLKTAHNYPIYASWFEDEYFINRDRLLTSSEATPENY